VFFSVKSLSKNCQSWDWNHWRC